jgi:hypothetical protein
MAKDHRFSSDAIVRPRGVILLLVAAALPAVIAYALLYRQGLAVPYQDDYNVILAFTTQYQHLATWQQKLVYVLTHQTNDYKMAFGHAIVGLEMEFVGHLNFGFFVTLGDLLLLPTVYLLWRTYDPKRGDLANRLMEFLPISILFFSLTYWETLNWAMAGLQNLSVILFSLLAIYLLIPKGTLVPRRGRLAFSCLSAILAALSSANGFFLAPVGLLVLLRRRAYAHSLAWGGSFLFPIVCYLYHYVPNEVTVHYMHRTWLIPKFVYHFFGFLGCAIPVRWAAALLGLAIFAVLLLAVLSRFEQTNPVAFYFTLWILITAVVVAWVRGLSASRYSIYSILLLIFCYAFLSHHLHGGAISFSKTRFYRFSLACFVGFCLLADISAYQHLAGRRRMVLSGLEHYRADPQVNSPMIDPAVRQMFPAEEEYERVTLTNAIREGVYTLP